MSPPPGDGWRAYSTRCLRGFCGTRSCFVVLSRALGSICNGHPASEVVKYQLLAITKFSISTDRLATNHKVGTYLPIL